MNTDLRQSLIHASRQFHQLGWMAGTAGNLSAKMPDNSFWITASSKKKRQISYGGFCENVPNRRDIRKPCS